MRTTLVSMNTQSSNRSNLYIGILVANATSILVISLCKFVFASRQVGAESLSNVLIWSSFILLPFLMGIICAWYWRNLGLKTGAYVGWSFLCVLIAIIASAVFLREGTICLLIVSPLIWGFTLTGAFIGRAMYRKKNNTLNSTVFGILLLLFTADVLSDHDGSNMVSDTLIINAPVEKVWPYVVEYDPIKLQEDYWLFRIGMPSPVQSTVDGHEVGAGRKCIFSNGYVFEEKMTVYKPNEELTFEIIDQPRDPEIMGHIDILRGQFILKDNGDGTTTLIGNSWYRLYVFPEWYFNLWSESITRNVHLRVMEHVKILSEKDV